MCQMRNPKAYKRYRTEFTQEAVHRAAEEGTTDEAVIGPRFSQRLKIGETGRSGSGWAMSALGDESRRW
ncbi:hypothetical protein GCM10007052_04150 [Halioglobus japonicus]|nr:hypothetical protein GCM10007052_04150 [Halioglobus japonicus]